MKKAFTSEFKEFINFYINDSVNFLENFNQKIDFLYLDSYDGHDPVKASEHQFKEAKASLEKLQKNSLILLDDKSAKTNLSIDFYKKNGFKVINETKNQILLSKI